MLLINQRVDVEASRRMPRGCITIGAACFVLLASACSNKDRVEAKQASTVTSAHELFLSPTQSEGLQYVAAYDKQLQTSADAVARVKKGMESLLFDPASAQYSRIRLGRNGAVCGKYNAKNRYGAYVGFRNFVMTSDGRIVTNDSSDNSDDWSTYYSAYVEACGTKAELAAYRSATAISIPTNSTADSPSDQEPDQILDAPPAPRKPAPADIPTA